MYVDLNDEHVFKAYMLSNPTPNTPNPNPNTPDPNTTHPNPSAPNPRQAYKLSELLTESKTVLHAPDYLLQASPNPYS